MQNLKSLTVFSLTSIVCHWCITTQTWELFISQHPSVHIGWKNSWCGQLESVSWDANSSACTLVCATSWMTTGDVVLELKLLLVTAPSVDLLLVLSPFLSVLPQAIPLASISCAFWFATNQSSRKLIFTHYSMIWWYELHEWTRNTISDISNITYLFLTFCNATLQVKRCQLQFWLFQRADVTSPKVFRLKIKSWAFFQWIRTYLVSQLGAFLQRMRCATIVVKSFNCHTRWLEAHIWQILDP